MQQLNVIGTYNIRDLGSYPTLGGQRTRKQWLIRSGNLDKLPIASQQQLYDYGVRTIIDIRDEWEVEHYPNVFSDSMDVNYHNLPLLGDALSNDEDWQRESKQYVHLHDLYNKYLEKCKTQIASIISTIATSDAITICHCHAGKDRTGIIVALILSVVGVAHNHIAHDYALSRQEINHLVDEWRQYAIAHDKALDELERGAASDPETILTMLHYIQEQYQSTEKYLLSCGMSIDTIAQLKTRFLEAIQQGRLYQPQVPTPPLNGPTMSDVIQPP